MIANYHTHTPRCRHSEGTEEEYVLAALDAGLEVLGFSDHTPWMFPGDYYSHMRMYPDELDGYCDAVNQVKKQYGGQLQIHLGLEVEYYPAYFEDLLSKARERGIEYFILGQHWVGNEINEPYCGKATEDEKLLQRYCNQVIDAMQTGFFTYVAHPDLINYVGDPKVYKQHMRRLCREAKACAVPLEINLLGLGTGRNYPNPLFWEVAAEEKCVSTIGYDAHRPDALKVPQLEGKAMEMVRTYGLDLVDRMQLRSIK